ncbi:MAG: DUF3659 domain-containing protein [Alphaproteobacteria bacterium]
MSANILGNAGGQVKLAYDKNGKVIGYVDENGNVVDAHGNVIGHVDGAGNVVDENGNVIGKAVSLPQRRLAYDKNGNIMGYIDKDGNVIDPGGNIIGKVQPDGSIVDANGNVMVRPPLFGRRLVYDKDEWHGHVEDDGN